jgi:processing peptidase subunit beta
MASLIKQLGRVSARKPAARTFATSAFEHLAAYPATKISTLPNGIRVATESTSAQTATVGVWIDAGSRFESAENNGVAHFLEHMIFNGTARRTRSALMQEVENIGGHLNAYTGREQTVFYAKVFKQDVGQAMDILSDILQNSKFEQHAIEMERGTILRELQEVEANNVELLFDYLHYTAYRGTALGRTILGSRENILKINRDDLLRHIKSYYTGPRLVICGAGAVVSTFFCLFHFVCHFFLFLSFFLSFRFFFPPPPFPPVYPNL